MSSVDIDGDVATADVTMHMIAALWRARVLHQGSFMLAGRGEAGFATAVSAGRELFRFLPLIDSSRPGLRLVVCPLLRPPACALPLHCLHVAQSLSLFYLCLPVSHPPPPPSPFSPVSSCLFVIAGTWVSDRSGRPLPSSWVCSLSRMPWGTVSWWPLPRPTPPPFR